MTKEVLKLALEALEEAKFKIEHKQDIAKRDLAITAIKEALAQPAQEPVAWGYRSHDGAIYDCISPEAHANAEGDYTVPLYTTPQQRPWVGLTDEEIKTILSQVYCDINQMKLAPDDRPQKETVGFLFARAIEQVLKEKNT
jgi:hypothetical protein